MTLKQIASDKADEIREACCWLLVFKKGRSWFCESLYLDYDQRSGRVFPDEWDRSTIESAVETDPHAALFYTYDSNMGGEEATVSTIAECIGWQYSLNLGTAVDAII